MSVAESQSERAWWASLGKLQGPGRLWSSAARISRRSELKKRLQKSSGLVSSFSEDTKLENRINYSEFRIKTQMLLLLNLVKPWVSLEFKIIFLWVNCYVFSLDAFRTSLYPL